MSISTAKHRIRTLTSGITTTRRLCTADAPAEGSGKLKKRTQLYRQLSALRGDAKGSVTATMERWEKEGISVSVSEVMDFVRQLRKYRDFKHALELIDCMEKRGMNITVNDQAVRLDLISKVKGVEMAEDYFSNLPEPAKNQKTYAALLCGYCQVKMVDKALELYEKMKKLNLASTALVSNNIMTLYLKLGQPEKVITHFQEMKAASISPDRVTYGLIVNSYTSLNDIESAERVIKEMNEGGQVTPDWTIYCSLAAFYNASGLFHKSKSVLKKAEVVMNRQDRAPYEYLISLYAAAGNLGEVKRVWNLLKATFTKMTNRSYLCMLDALRKLSDVDGLKKCFHEWESGYDSYDVRLANVVVDAYLKNGMAEEAETVWKKAEKALETAYGSDFRMLEMFIDYYLKRREMDLASKYLEIIKSKGWKPGKERSIAFLEYLEEARDLDGAEEFIQTLKQLVSERKKGRLEVSE